MRIIAGEFRSRRLKTVPGSRLRPTSDRLRETLFNVLGRAVAGSVFVDCYAGTGAVGLEALSRGASLAVFLEQSRAALKVLQANIDSLEVAARSRILEGPAGAGLHRLAREGCAAGFIFLDPPYREMAEYEKALAAAGEFPKALIIAEHSKREALPDVGLERVRLLEQGDSALSFYRRPAPTPSG